MSVRAVVTQGARVGIVAFAGCGRMFAATRFGADVIRTRIAVVTIHRLADADAIFAVVSHGARVAVQALPLGQQVVRTALGAQAGIGGAGILVIASVGVICHTLAHLTVIFKGTGIVIITLAVTGFVLTAIDRVTGVQGAGVVIVTIDCLPVTLAIFAEIVERTHRPVIAR